MSTPADPRSDASMQQALRDGLSPAATLAAHSRSGVLVAMFDLAQWRAHAQEAAAVIDAAEAARAARQRRVPDRETRVLAYALHRLLLAEVLGCTPAAVPLHRDARGCPRLRDDALFTSLGHAGERIAVAVSALGPVGIDVEPIEHAAGMSELAAQIAHPDELRALRRLDPASLGRELLALWVRKEALLKAAGIGLEREMDTFAAPWALPLPLPEGPFHGRCVVLLALHDAGWMGAVAAPPGAPLAFAQSPGRG